MTNIEHIATLGGQSRLAAIRLITVHPYVTITSSRRSIEQQSVAMAKNCHREPYYVFGKPGLIVTYKWSRAAQLCHDYSITHIGSPVQDIAAAFADMLMRLPIEELRRLSKHLAPVTELAAAFDVLPLLTDLGKKQAAERHHDPELTMAGIEARSLLKDEAKARNGTFLEREGGLTIWHWQE